MCEMAIERDKLRHMLEEEGAENVISSTLYCDKCGYQLRMLPYIGRCPECGNSYNARGLKMEGIFLPQQAEFPGSDILAGLASAGLVAWLAAGLVQRFDLWALLFAALFGYMAVVFLRQSWARLKRFVRGQRLTDKLLSGDDDL